MGGINYKSSKVGLPTLYMFALCVSFIFAIYRLFCVFTVLIFTVCLLIYCIVLLY